jgi:hypothetical protein
VLRLLVLQLLVLLLGRHLLQRSSCRVLAVRDHVGACGAAATRSVVHVRVRAAHHVQVNDSRGAAPDNRQPLCIPRTCSEGLPAHGCVLCRVCVPVVMAS